MMKKIALAVVLSTTALSAIAEESKDFYAQVNAGYAWGMKSKVTLEDDDIEGDKKAKTGKSFSIGLEGGAQINEYLRAGLSFDYMPSFKFAASSLAINGYKVDKDPKIKSMNIMANLFVDAGNFSGFKPYAMLGFGMARNKANDFNFSNDSDSIDAKGKTKNNFAFKLGLGFKYAINEDFDVDVRYQYLNLGKAKWDNINGQPATVKLTANQLMLGVAYKF